MSGNTNLFTRDYEVSVWTLQDSYITTLKWSGVNHQGQIQEPKMNIVDDGTEEFSFSIPMYLQIKDGGVVRKIENPIWYNKNEIIIKNMRKVKVIFNKTLGTAAQKKVAGERVFEFIITKVEDSHEEDNPVCNISCEGLAFHELGKQGYKLELSSDLFYERSNQQAERGYWYDNFWTKHEDVPEANIEYWMQDLGIKKAASNYTPRSGEWVYSVQMNYEAYDSSRHLTGKNYSDIIYEESYIEAWNDDLEPTSISEAREKQRMVDASESNVYNMTQTIAETFEVFCKYIYSYDDNYYITGRTIVFYNNFLKDNTGEVFEDLTYPHSATQVSREYDGTDITTKMYVRPIDDESSATGQISIIDTSANPTGEDYVLDFEYLHSIGTISDQQYDEIKNYKKKMREYNYGRELNDSQVNIIDAAKEVGKRLKLVVTKTDDDEVEVTVEPKNTNETFTNGTHALIDGLECKYVSSKSKWELIDPETDDSIQGLIALQEQLIKKSDEKITIEANLTTAQNELTNAEERQADAAKHIGSGVDQNVWQFNELDPKIWGVTQDSDRPSDPANKKYYYQVSLTSGDDKGIIFNTVKLYKEYETSSHQFNEMLPLNVTPAKKLWDTEKNTKDWSKATADEKKAVEKFAENYKKVKGSEFSYKSKTGEEAVKLKFEDWLKQFDLPGQAKDGMPKITDKTINGYKSGVNSTKKYYILRDTSHNQLFIAGSNSTVYDIFNDSVAWIAYMQGAANITKVKAKKKDGKVAFEEYVLKSITVNGSSYPLKFTDNGRITKESWNQQVMARRAWCAHYQYGVGPNAVSIGTDYVQIAPTNWIKKNFAYRTGASTYKIIGSNGGNATDGTRTNNHLLIDVSVTGIVSWSYKGASEPAIDTLWTRHNGLSGSTNNVLANASQKCFDAFVGEEFGADWGKNNITQFIPVYDKDYNLSGIKNIFSNTPLNKVYATYEFNPTTYYKEIVEMWNRKIAAATAQVKEYTLDSGRIKVEVEQLEGSIRRKLIAKFNDTRKFDQMMGPALRESYWQPENYENYGDLYSGFVNTVTKKNGEPGYIVFNNDLSAPVPKKDVITASFFWDTELFTGEDKDYYEFGVLATKIHYPCINLLSLFGNNTASIINFLSGDSTELCFSYYNDSFDKEEYNTSTQTWQLNSQLYSAAGNQWYYKQHITYTDQSGNTSVNAGEYDSNVEVKRVEADRVYYMNGASMKFCFIKYENTIIPALMVTGLDEVPDSTLHFVTCQTSNVTNGVVGAIRPGANTQLGYYDSEENTFTSLATVQPQHWIPWTIRSTNMPIIPNGGSENNNYTIVYPRIQINSLQLKTGDLTLTLNDISLNQYEDYYLMTRDTNYILTIKPATLFKNYTENNTKVNVVGSNMASSSYTNPQMEITFTISNGGTYVYQDALKVIRENSIPKVSYTVKPNILRQDFIAQLYNKLGQIVMINDTELKFENVFGYISSLDLDLDKPQEDSVEVKNYKNKFEDLFSSIAAETEEMRKNSGLLQSLSSGTLPVSIQNAVQDAAEDNNNINNIIQAYLDANFDGPEIVQQQLAEIVNEVDEVIGYGEEGLIELANLTNHNASILAGFVQNIAALTTPSIKYLSAGESIATVTGYKPGDVFVDSNGTQYIASTYNNIMPFYDGSTSKITGANINVDADKGVIDIEGGSEINIKSGNDITIAADSIINIIGNKELNLGGCTINIGSAMLGGDTDIAKNYPDDGDQSEQAGENGVVLVGEELSPGGINIVSSYVNTEDDSVSSGVFIHPESIKMQSSDIIMKGAQRISMWTSGGQQDGSDTSVVYIDKDDGIWLGAGQGIDIFAGLAKTQITVDEETGAMAKNSAGTSVSIHNDRILMGVVDGSATVVKINNDMMLISSTSNIDSITAANKDSATPSASNMITGAIFASDRIAFATRTSEENKFYRNLISMKGKEGIIFGHARTNNTGSTLYTQSGGSTTNLMHQDSSGQYDIDGSFVQIGWDGIKLGSMANMYINTNNFKLQTKVEETSGNVTNQYTILALGANLQGIQANTSVDAVDSLNANTTNVSLLVTKSGTYVHGVIHATSLILNHPIPQEDVDGLPETLDDMQDDIDNINAIGATIAYAKSTSNTVIPTSGWIQQTAIEAGTATMPQTNTTYKYLWTRTTVIYSNGHQEASYSISAYGDTGDTGVSVTGLRCLYYLKNGTSTSGLQITTSTTIYSDTAANHWTSAIPNYIDDTYYYFRCEEHTYSDNHKTWSAPYIDYGMTYATTTATSASVTAQTVATSMDPYVGYGVFGYDETKTNTPATSTTPAYSANHYPKWGNTEYGLIVGNSTKKGLLIGSTSGITIVAQAGTGQGRSMVLDSSGIALYGSTINLRASENSTDSVIAMNSDGIVLGSSAGITIGTSSYLKINSGNFRLDEDGNSTFYTSTGSVVTQKYVISSGSTDTEAGYIKAKVGQIFSITNDSSSSSTEDGNDDIPKIIISDNNHKSTGIGLFGGTYNVQSVNYGLFVYPGLSYNNNGKQYDYEGGVSILGNCDIDGYLRIGNGLGSSYLTSYSLTTSKVYIDGGNTNPKIIWLFSRDGYDYEAQLYISVSSNPGSLVYRARRKVSTSSGLETSYPSWNEHSTNSNVIRHVIHSVNFS